MRTKMIGRWVGRAVVFAALAIGFAAVGATAASAVVGPQYDVAVQLDTEWG